MHIISWLYTFMLLLSKYINWLPIQYWNIFTAKDLISARIGFSTSNLTWDFEYWFCMCEYILHMQVGYGQWWLGMVMSWTVYAAHHLLSACFSIASIGLIICVTKKFGVYTIAMLWECRGKIFLDFVRCWMDKYYIVIIYIYIYIYICMILKMMSVVQ